MTTRLSLLKPTASLTLGNYLGALRPMAAAQHEADGFYGIADLHALTVPHDPATLRAQVAEQAALMIAVGLDASTLFVQSQVPTHAQLGYLLECVASTGELNRMIQFKEKGRGVDSTRTSLFTYPVLMAADILLYRPAEVPVGDDQRQHLELTRDLAIRFNTTYGPVFTVPEMTAPPVGARIMDLANPTAKMGKTASAGATAAGTIRILDSPDDIGRRVMRAVTDGDVGADAVRRDPTKPGVTNLLEILEACGGCADDLRTYGALKAAVVDAVVAELEPIQKRYADLAADPAEVRRVFDAGADRATEVTGPVLAAARRAMGLG